jgi:hypothetical protein
MSNLRSFSLSPSCTDNDESDIQDNTKKRRYNQIIWKSGKEIPPPPPPPPFDNSAPDKEYKLTNGTILKKITKHSTATYDHYEYNINSLDDMLSLADFFYDHKLAECKKTSNINFYMISRLEPHINELYQLIGMDQVKHQVLSLIIFFLQDLDDSNQDMLHSVIYGNPGVGKTRLIYILANIFASLGITTGKKVLFVKRADLIGQYLGQTAAKTKKVLEEARGGVIVIDEAYSLSEPEQRDSFSRECIDTINQYLSECKRDLICIIAGYKEDLESRFFRANPGLKRRFAFHYEITDYNAQQLRDIFIQNVKNNGWRLDKDALEINFFENNFQHFEHNGGSMELLFAKAKYEHARRVFSGFFYQRKILTKEDIEAGLEKFLEHNNKKQRDDGPPMMMYT